MGPYLSFSGCYGCSVMDAPVSTTFTIEMFHSFVASSTAFIIITTTLSVTNLNDELCVLVFLFPIVL